MLFAQIVNVVSGNSHEIFHDMVLMVYDVPLNFDETLNFREFSLNFRVSLEFLLENTMTLQSPTSAYNSF